MRRIISLLLSICVLLGLCPVKVMANDLQTKYLKVSVNEKTDAYECLWDGETVYFSVENLAEISNYEWTQTDNSLMYDFFREYNDSKGNSVTEIQTEVFVEVENNKKLAKVKAMDETYSVSCHMVDEKLFLPLEKFLYLLHTEWMIENDTVYVTPIPLTILDFTAIHFEDIIQTASQSEDLLIDTGWIFSNTVAGQLVYSAIAEVFDDFDGKIFMVWWPGQGHVETAECYEEAILQLARDDKEFVDEKVQTDAMETIVNSVFYLNNAYLNKIQNIISVPENIDDIVQSVPDAVSVLEDLSKKFPSVKVSGKIKNISEKIKNGEIDSSFLEIPELEAVGDGLAILQCVWNTYDTANRVKGWNEEYLEQLQVLANYKNPGNVNKNVEKYVESSAQRLVDSYHDPSKAQADEALQSTLGLLFSKTFEESPFGKVFSIMGGVGACYGTFDVNAANTYDAYAELSKVTFSIKIEQMVRELFKNDDLLYETNKLTNERIKEYRNQLMLYLRLNLRNKAQLYNINVKSNKDKNWVNTEQAKEMHNEIVMIYTMLAELIEIKDYDSFIVLEKDLDDIHETIPSDILLDEKPKNNEERYKVYAEKIKQYEKKYGIAEVVQESEWFSYMTGLCFMKLVDFSQSAQEDLLLVYQTNVDTEYGISREYKFEIWGFEGNKITMLDTGELFGTDGDVKHVYLAEYNGNIYLVTGGTDAFGYYYYHGYSNNNFGVIREVIWEINANGEYDCSINGNAVTHEVLDQEEKWFGSVVEYDLNNECEKVLMQNQETKQKLFPYYNVETASGNEKMTEKEIYEKLVKHYKKGTEDSEGDDLTVMKGEFYNNNQYETTVRYGVPGNELASQKLYTVTVDSTTGEVIQTRVLTDNRIVEFNLNEN